MSTWILPCCVDENADYYYEIDNAFDKLGTIFWGQSKPITNIAVGDIVYIYETSPVKAIVWKCKVLAVDVPYEKTSDIDDSEFGHGNAGIYDSYIKITALRRYYGESKDNLAYDELCKNGLTTRMQGPFRPNAQLLSYINSI